MTTAVLEAPTNGTGHAPEPLVLPSDNSGPSILFAQAVCLNLNLSGIGNRKNLPTSVVEVDADRALISVSKQLLDSDQLKAISRLDGEVRRYLYENALPSSFKAGIYIIPISLLADIDERLTALKTQREGLIQQFIDIYPMLVDVAATRLRSAFNERDYKGPEELAKCFEMNWMYISYDVPGKLRQISREVYKREQAKAQVQIKEAVEEIRALLRTSMAELVGHMVDRLTPGNDGKPKQFHKTMITNLNQFISVFDARNLTDDRELSDIVQHARGLINGVEPDLLRKSEDVRKTVLDGFVKLKDTLDTMVVNRPIRAISSEDV